MPPTRVAPPVGQVTAPYGQGSAAYGQGSAAYGQAGAANAGYGTAGSAYANHQAASAKKKSSVGWWLGAGALLLVIVVVATFVIRGLGNGTLGSRAGGGEATSKVCPDETLGTPDIVPQPNDGRVHGGPVSYPQLGPPWGPPHVEVRVPFGKDAVTQEIVVQANYARDSSWVASVLVGELAAGDGFFTPQQGSQIVVKCILGRFYGNNEVQSNVKVDRAATIDGHQGWLVESHLTFDIPNLQTKGELMIVAIVTTGSTAGLYYASIPDTTPQLVQPAREALKNLKVDG